MMINNYLQINYDMCVCSNWVLGITLILLLSSNQYLPGDSLRIGII